MQTLHKGINESRVEAMFRILSIFIALALSSASVAGAEAKLREQYKVYMASIRSFSEKQDIAGLEELGGRIEADFESLGSFAYGQLMLQLIGALGSDKLDGARQFELEREFAQSALLHADQLSVITQADLVLHLRATSKFSVEKIVAVRGERIRVLRYWLHTWTRLETERDQRWDAEKSMPNPATLPTLPYGWPGMPPERIEDAELRQQYIDAKNENALRIAEYKRQLEIHRSIRLFAPRAESEIILLYQADPDAFNEVKSELQNAENVPEDIKMRIIKAVSRPDGDTSAQP